jgi:hypothetical protein
MRTRSTAALTGSVCLALSVAPGCLVVESGPLDRLRAADAGSSDAPISPDDVPADTGPGNLAADECGNPDTFLLTGSGTFEIDSTALDPDFSILGTASGGNDAFFQFDGVSGEFWHFHLAALTAARDPVLYVVQAAGGVCSSSAVAVRDACAGTEGDEHFAFVPPTTGRFFLGIDDGMSGGGRYRLQVVRPTCGNSIAEHGEPCDEGMAAPTCDATCHIVLSDIDGTGLTSVPPGRHNDTTTEAMNVILAAADPSLDVAGTIPPGDCYPDVFSIDLLGGARIQVTARNTTTGAACASASEASYALELQNAAGSRIGGGVDAAGCPTVDQTLMNPGRYFVWLNATGDRSRPVNYTLRFERTP